MLKIMKPRLEVGVEVAASGRRLADDTEPAKDKEDSKVRLE